MALPYLLIQKGFSGEEIDNFLEAYRFLKSKRKKAYIRKRLLIWAFVKMGIEKDPEAITPKSDVYKNFQFFCKFIGYPNPRIGQNTLTQIFSELGLKFSETRTHRQGKQVRAFKGLKLRVR